MENKFETLVNNYINGNISTFRKDLNKLSKKKLIEFLTYCDSKYYEPNILIIGLYLN